MLKIFYFIAIMQNIAIILSFIFWSNKIYYDFNGSVKILNNQIEILLAI
jgi:cell division protein FtsL